MGRTLLGHKTTCDGCGKEIDSRTQEKVNKQGVFGSWCQDCFDLAKAALGRLEADKAAAKKAEEKLAADTAAAAPEATETPEAPAEP
jgi:hypothetical protein